MTTRRGPFVAQVRGLYRYPVKSMAAESLSEVEIGWHGLTGDRRWAFIRATPPRNGFPWLTLRQESSMTRYHARFVDPTDPERSMVKVRCPSGQEYEVTDPAVAVELGRGARPFKQDHGTFDSASVSLISTASVAEVSVRGDVAADPRRFRPNLLLDTLDAAPFPEEGWVGSTLHVGTAELRVDRRDPRCSIVNLDPESGVRAAAVLRHVVQQLGGCTGVYASVVRPGRVQLNDGVYLEGRSV